MPRNGSGVFTLAGADFPAVALTVIDPVKHNNNFNDVAAAMTSSIAVDGQSVITADIPMFGKKFTGVGDGSLRTHSASLGQVQDDRLNWVIATGTANAITATFAPAITALVDGQTVRVRATAANTGAVTFSPNGLTARPITDFGGSPLTAGVIYAVGQELVLVYNSTALRWELANPALGSHVKVGTEAIPAWPATWRVVDMGTVSAILSQEGSGAVTIAYNAYHDGTTWRTRVLGAATLIQALSTGGVQHLSAASVAAGVELTFVTASFTSAAGVMTLAGLEHTGHPVAGYVKAGAGKYLISGNPAAVSLALDTLTTVAAPAGAKGVMVHLANSVRSINAISYHAAYTHAYNDVAGTVSVGFVVSSARENPAQAATTLNESAGVLFAPVISGNIYLKVISSDSSVASAYRIIGYTV